MRTNRRLGWAVAAVSLVAALVAGSSVGSTAGAGLAEPQHRPIIFVHGFAGSGNQFESQAMRFASNGYPVDHILVHEYDSIFASESQADVATRLDALIAEVQAATGAAQVDLLGHSLGTGLMQGYLNSDPERAADVAHYVNLDGSPGAAPPGGVPTLAVWGAGSPTREITGATNVYFPNQAHTQVVTSSETFVEIYEFFNDEPPISPDIVRQAAGEITLEGRALEFISNAGVEDATLSFYEVDGATGLRLDAIPEATFALTGDGSWGPFSPDPDKRYELVITKETSAHHFYFESFVRTNHLMRLLTSQSGAGIDALWEKSEDHANIVVLRNKEWWGDQPGANDEVTIDGTQVINAATAPQSKRAIALFAYDAGIDGMSDVSVPIPSFFGIPFLTAVDLFLAADTPPTDTVAVTETPRLGAGPVTVNVPNWAGITDRVTVQLNDYHVTRNVDFPDVGEGHPFFDDITWAATAGIAEGFADGTFGPTRAVSRQAMAAFLHRTMGAPAGPFPPPGFSDVPLDHPFYDEIAWLASEGIADGYADGTFRPTDPVGRQAMAAMLHRVNGSPAGPFPDPGFTDVPDDHPFVDEIAWLAHAGIADGFPDGTFRPLDPVSRQVMARLLHRTAMLSVPLDG